MRLELTKTWGGHKKGAKLNVSPNRKRPYVDEQRAAQLLEDGFAKPAREKAPAKPKKKEG